MWERTELSVLVVASGELSDVEDFLARSPRVGLTRRSAVVRKCEPSCLLFRLSILFQLLIQLESGVSTLLVSARRAPVSRFDAVPRAACASFVSTLWPLSLQLCLLDSSAARARVRRRRSCLGPEEVRELCRRGHRPLARLSNEGGRCGARSIWPLPQRREAGRANRRPLVSLGGSARVGIC